LKQEADDLGNTIGFLNRDPLSLRMSRFPPYQCVHHILDSYTYLMTFVLQCAALYLIPATELTMTCTSGFPYTD